MGCCRCSPGWRPRWIPHWAVPWRGRRWRWRWGCGVAGQTPWCRRAGCTACWRWWPRSRVRSPSPCRPRGRRWRGSSPREAAGPWTSPWPPRNPGCGRLPAPQAGSGPGCRSPRRCRGHGQWCCRCRKSARGSARRRGRSFRSGASISPWRCCCTWPRTRRHRRPMRVRPGWRRRRHPIRRRWWISPTRCGGRSHRRKTRCRGGHRVCLPGWRASALWLTRPGGSWPGPRSSRKPAPPRSDGPGRCRRSRSGRGPGPPGCHPRWGGRGCIVSGRRSSGCRRRRWPGRPRRHTLCRAWSLRRWCWRGCPGHWPRGRVWREVPCRFRGSSRPRPCRRIHPPRRRSSP